MTYREKGFSLIELVVTVSILLTLITVGVPYFQSTVQRTMLDTTTQKIKTVLYSSRQLAVTHNADITTCMVVSSICQSSWQQGLLTIFLDENNNKQIDAAEQVFSRIDVISTNVSLQWSGSGGRPYIRYTHLGFAKEFGNVLITAGAYQKKIILNRAGRLYLISL